MNKLAHIVCRLVLLSSLALAKPCLLPALLYDVCFKEKLGKKNPQKIRKIDHGVRKLFPESLVVWFCSWLMKNTFDGSGFKCIREGSRENSLSSPKCLLL